MTAVVAALEVSDDDAAVSAGRQLAPLLHDIDDAYLVAVSHLVVSWTAALEMDLDRAADTLTASVAELREQDDRCGLPSRC